MKRKREDERGNETEDEREERREKMKEKIKGSSEMKNHRDETRHMRRFAGTHGCVLNLHTETFLTYTRGGGKG